MEAQAVISIPPKSRYENEDGDSGKLVDIRNSITAKFSVLIFGSGLNYELPGYCTVFLNHRVLIFPQDALNEQVDGTRVGAESIPKQL